MDVIEAVRKRKSIRGYKPDPVPKKVLEEILEIACRAPSAMNTQRWEFTVITGKVLDDLKQAYFEAFNSGARWDPEHYCMVRPVKGEILKGVYRERQIGIAAKLYDLMGMAKPPNEDPVQRNAWIARGMRYVEAPVVIIVCTDRYFTESEPLLEVGAVIQNICLIAPTFGLGTCIQDAGILYPQVLRKYAHIPDSKRIIINIAIGYPDWDFPANKVESDREPAKNLTTWVGLD